MCSTPFGSSDPIFWLWGRWILQCFDPRAEIYGRKPMLTGHGHTHGPVCTIGTDLGLSGW